MRSVFRELLEPGSMSLLVIALVAAAPFAIRRGRCQRAGRAWVWLWCAGYVLLALPVVSDGLAAGLVSRFPTITDATAADRGAVVVLAGNADYYRFGTQHIAVPNVDTTLRILEGARVYHLLDAPLVVASGTRLPALGDRGALPQSMRRALIAAGVPEARIALDTSSTTTNESAVAVRQLLRGAGITRAVLVTSATHMPRSLRTFKAAGVDVVAAPSPRPWSGPSGGVMRFVPSTSALAASAACLHEYVGLVYYALRGWA